jgi:Ca-activated chloride channel family protein
MAGRLFRITIFRIWIAALLLGIGWPLGSQVKMAESGPPVSLGSHPFTITANVDLVLLDVSVRDAQGGFVSGLPESDFTVLEDGKPQKITQFANRDVPVTLGLIVDNSGSMRPKKPDVVTAALVLIQSSNPEDEVFVINFNDYVWRGLPDIVPFTDDIQLLRRALTLRDPEGRTSLYDAILAGLHQLDMGRRSKKTLVVVSDGGDNASTHTLKEVLHAALKSQATIYTVGVFDQDDKDRNPDVLKKLARVTGGVCYLPKNVSAVADICRQIAKDIRTRYTIGYVPPNPNTPGVRHIKVLVKSPDHEKLIARTRTSYLITRNAE